MRFVRIIAGLLIIASAAWHLLGQMRGSDTTFATPYQAVLLTNGSVYFGNLSR